MPADPSLPTSRALPRLAWAMGGLGLLLLAVGAGLYALNLDTPVAASWGVEGGKPRSATAVWNDIFGYLVLGVLTPLLGVRIVARRARHPIGWLFCALGLVEGTILFLQEYLVYGVFTAPGRLPGVLGAAWVVNWLWVFNFTLPVWSVLVFPNGQLPMGRWRWAVVPSVAYTACMIGSLMVQDPMTSAFSQSNPFPVARLQPLSNGVFYFALLMLLLTLGATGLWVTARFRRARGAERQQFKWLAAAAGLLLVVAPIGVALSLAGFTVANTLVSACAAFFPVAVSIAILRYRLYDVDLLIRRTLVYGALTGALALVYFGSVALLQGTLRAVTGQASPLAVVLSTLAIAALFNPLRRRIQGFIDRRFYRQQYDAQQTLATFAAALRADTNADLDHLTDELLSVIQQTMQPAHVSVWLREPGATHERL